MRMLYSQRTAYAKMGRWRPVHRVLWAVYQPFARFVWARAIWFRYRQLWPVILLAFLVVGCATAAPPTPRADAPALPAGVGSAPETVDTLSGDITFAMIGGKASWYCSSSSPCTSGYGPADLVAAIDPSTGIGKGTRLIVHHGNRHVTVQVVDVCACGGSRVIDLTSGAFSRLAPLSRGVIDVAIEVVDRTAVTVPRSTLPPTDTRSEP